mmetsp:Transcript_20180/g.34790  ORF Transcript_20180/g.34790 Transcript_20180/m.34790 type:complete len:494 (+) Transcript_20180:252-1733(+)|eukprot:CAMPEP_0184691472 /NCGR_PEP_ID=MMETSP0313-20130426/316_1 /TAXON_ID=2792 /ORGANISM="Porphyridium aerugineum, Strain SAG 1380-2" /LENGTH=493 /DNA_ID=CAMNT_0027149199 /DNA_START=240 /DNA_END=1721 /DNA_ORIENTATION=+
MAKSGLAKVVLSTLFLVTILFAPSITANEEDVVVLTKDNFQKVIDESELVLVKFYAPWCGHCKSMKDDFIAAAGKLKGTAVLADVDATVEKELAEQFGVKGFPSLKVFTKGKFLKDYQGARDTASMIAFMEKALLPAFTELTTKKAVEEFVAGDADTHIRMIAVEPKDKEAFALACATAVDSLGKVKFGIAKTADLAKSIGSKLQNTLVVFLEKQAKTASSTHALPAEKADVAALFLKAITPVWGEISLANAKVYVEQKVDLVIMFTEDIEADALAPIMKAAAEAKRAKDSASKASFVYTVGENLKGFKKHMFGEADIKVPIAIYRFVGDDKYTFPQDQTPTAENIVEWVSKVEAGEYEPPLKSQPEPEDNAGPVITVVGNTWKKIVEDPAKDVFIMQMAPWCGHCKKMKPNLEKLAEHIKDEENIVIAMMDATENDSPKAYKARGFPTCHFFPAGDVKQGITYNGDRSEGDMFKFIKEHAKSQHKLASKDEL